LITSERHHPPVATGIGRRVLTQTLATRNTDPTSVNAAPPGHILLVEDDATIRDLVAGVLEGERYVVTVSRTPEEAMMLLDQGGFDLVITDGFSTLPGAVFITTADLVRHAGPTPVALFSAHTHHLDVAKAAGFRDLITKPFDLDTLLHQVKVLLDRSDEPMGATLSSSTQRGVS
jgi:two-component system, OmpR family, response regulator